MALFLAGVVFGWAALARVLPLGSGAATTPVTRTSILSYSGRDLLPAVSPDGRMVAFVSGRDGVDKIWLRQLATGEEAALTDGTDTVPRFSPDGATILFARYERGGWSLYRVPVVGGQPRKVLDQATEGDWSPDGTRLAFTRQRSDGQWLAGVAAVDGSQIRESLPVTTALGGPRWSPDSRSFIVVQSGVQATFQDQFRLYDATTLGTSTVVPIEQGGRVSVPAWSGTGAIVYAQSSDVTAFSPQSRISLQQISGGGRTLAWIPAFVVGLDILGDGSLVIDTALHYQNLREDEWTPAGLRAGRWLTRGTSSDRQPAYTIDGKSVVFSAMRNGNLDLWMTESATGATHRITDDQAQDWDPGFTPDGKHLLWSSNRSGIFEIWIAEPDGRNARQLSKDGYDAENPTATPDGQWVVYGAGAEPTMGVWKIRVDGTQVTKLAGGVNAHPEISPDGRYVQYHTNAIGASQLHVISIDDGRPVMPPITLAASRGPMAVSVGRGRWRPDGRALVFVGVDANGVSCLYEQVFRPGDDTSSTRRVLQKSELTALVESFGISPDGKRVATSFIDNQYTLLRLDGLPGVTSK